MLLTDSGLWWLEHAVISSFAGQAGWQNDEVYSGFTVVEFFPHNLRKLEHRNVVNVHVMHDLECAWLRCLNFYLLTKTSLVCANLQLGVQVTVASHTVHPLPLGTYLPLMITTRQNLTYKRKMLRNEASIMSECFVSFFGLCHLLWVCMGDMCCDTTGEASMYLHSTRLTRIIRFPLITCRSLRVGRNWSGSADCKWELLHVMERFIDDTQQA